MDHFTPLSAAIGGGLIGLAAALLWLGIGRIAGISGILGALLTPRRGDIAWRIAFVVGLILAAPLYRALGGAVPAIELPRSLTLVVVAGLLVGVGTRLGGGCTSGHGVCGVARLSSRSLAATALFVAMGIAGTFLARHLIGA